MDPFYTRLLLSMVIGGIWVATATMAAEKLGSKIGGFIAGLPSTVVVALFFIGWTQGSQQAFDATTTIPLAFAINAIFLLVYAILVNRGLMLGIGGALTTWLGLQGLVVLGKLESFTFSIVVWMLSLFVCYHLLQNVLEVRPHREIFVQYRPSQILGRAIFSGAIIATAVMLSKIGGPLLGGIFSAFPAVYVSTLVITAKSVGVQFSRSLTTPLMVSSVVNCVVFGIVLRFLILELNLIGATIIAYFASMVSAFFIYQFIKRQMVIKS